MQHSNNEKFNILISIRKVGFPELLTVGKIIFSSAIFITEKFRPIKKLKAPSILLLPKDINGYVLHGVQSYLF
ncbi:hypothetical protein SRDD_39620 [Serratia sp. DD3]|nr:hypothetical protein SRDD_39620 [Serratia sp. DD3]